MKPKIIIATLLSIATALSAPCAQARDHHFVLSGGGTSHLSGYPNPFVRLIDTSELSRADEKVTAWTMMLYKFPENLAGNNKKLYKYGQVRVSYDCESKTAALLEGYVYDTSGVPSYFVIKPINYVHPAPDAVGEQELDDVCSNTLPSYGYSTPSDALADADNLFDKFEREHDVYVAPPIPADSSTQYYTNTDGDRVHRPVFDNTRPAGATAHCADGSWSFSQHARGTCSHHGGVAGW